MKNCTSISGRIRGNKIYQSKNQRQTNFSNKELYIIKFISGRIIHNLSQEESNIYEEELIII